MKKNLIYYLSSCLLMLGATQMSAQYCTTGVGPTSTVDSHVDSIGLTGDAATVINYQKACAATGLEDFTATQSASVTAGSNYDVTVVFGSCGTTAYIGSGEVWIDWNQNDVFDASESIGTWSNLNIPSDTMVYTFNVPTSAFNGATRMRVMHQEGSGGVAPTLPLDPCASYSWGSVADFSVVVSGGVAITCPNPSMLTTTGVFPTSANLAWIESGTATTWAIEYGAPNFVPGTGTTVLAGSNPFNLTSLTDNTSYEYYVRAICGPGDSSLWTGPLLFTTPCLATVPNYSTDFSTFLPTCWNEADAGSPATGPSSLGAGSWGQAGTTARTNLYTTGQSDWLLSSGFDLSAGGYELVLNTNATDFSPTTVFNGMGSDDSVQVVISTDGGATWTPLYTWDAANPLLFNANDIIIDLSAYTGTFNMFGVWASEGATDDSEDYYVIVNDFEIRTPLSCPDPSLLTSANITANSVDFGWTENGTATSWVVQYGPTNFTLGSGMSMATGTNPLNVTGLNFATVYDFYVIAVCAPGDSSTWVGPLTITTPCAAYTPNYFTDFANFLPICWDEADAGSPVTGPSSLGAGSWGQAGTTARINLFFNNKSDWLLSPEFDLSAGGYELVLNTNATDFSPTTAFGGMGSDDSVQVVISTDGGATWAPIYTWDAANPMLFAANNINIDLSAYTGASNLFGIWASEGSTDDAEDYYVIINDFEVRTPPNCFAPTALTAANITGATADLAWTENGTATNWQIEYGPTGFAIGSGTIAGANANPFTLTGLMASSDYDYYVRAICSPGDSSAFEGPFNFQTPCGPIMAPWTESFGATTLPNCWTDRGNDSYIFSTNPGWGATGTADYTTGGGTNYAWVDGSGTVGTFDTLTSPEINISGLATPHLCFALFSNNEDDAGNNTIMVQFYDGATWNNVVTFQQNFGPGWAPFSYDLSGYTVTGNTGVRFIINTNSSGDAFYNDILIDDVSMNNGGCPQFCVAPSLLTSANITATSFDFGWTENGTATSWQVSYGPTGTLAGAGMAMFSATNPTNITGLMQNTGYDVYVRAICGAGDTSLWTGPLNITTLASCPIPSNLTATNITANAADLSWTENGTATTWQVEYGTQGFTQGAGTFVTTTNNPHSLTSLTDNTDYSYYVRAICAPGDTSPVIGPFNFRTPCTPEVAPWLDDVETHATTTNLGVSNCWSAPSTSAFDWNIDGSGSTPSTGTGPTGAFSGVNYFYVEASSGTNGDVAELVSPFVDMTALTAPVLEFYYHMFGDQRGVMSDLYIDIYDGAIWNTVDSIIGEQQAAQADPWRKRVVDLAAFSGTVQVRFRAIKNGAQWGDVSLDDIAIKEAPTCFDPTNLAATNITATSTDLSWTENGTATSWEVSYGAPGTAAGAGISTVVGTNPTTVTGLMPNSPYVFYVRAICAPGDSSDWFGPITIATPCLPEVAPWLDDVEAHATTTNLDISNCWTAPSTSAFDWNIDGAASTPSTGTGPTGAFSGNNYFYVEASSGANGDVAELVSPFVDMTALADPILEFYYHMFGDQRGVMSDLYIDIYDGATWNTVDSLIGEQQAAQADPWLKRTVSLSAFSGTVQVRFRAIKNGAQYGDVSIDDVAIKAAPIANLVITEIMYNPPEGGVDSLEFVEIYNNDVNPVDLTNYTLSGISYTFPAVTLPVGGYYVIGVNASAFNTVYGFAADGIATGGLSNGGEAVIVRNATGLVVDSVRYDDSAPWPSGSASGQPDGGGSSLVLCDTASDNADGANWNACVTSTGMIINGEVVLASPGAANFCPAPLDVAVAAYYNLDSIYCNAGTISGSVIITNMSPTDANNVSYTITANGTPLGGGTITLLAGNASDTITVGPFPAATGIANIVTMTSLTGDVNASNDMLSMLVYVSNTTATATVLANVDCNGDSTGSVMAVSADGIGSYSYEWNADPNLATATLTNMPAGMHTVVVMDSVGCTDTAMVTLTEPTAIVLTDTVTNVLCNGDSTGMAMVMVAGGTPAYSFAWSNGIASDTIMDVPAGSYTVTVTDGNGCMEMLTSTVAEPTAIVLTDTVTNVLCNGDSTGMAMVMVAGGTPAYSFAWSNGITSDTIMNVPAGSYTVTVTDGNGCMGTLATTVAEPTALDVTITDNGDGSAYATATGGTAGYTFLWDAAAGNQTTDTATALINNGAYMVTVTDANGCTDTASVVIIISGVNSIANLSNLNLFPNPTNANVFVELELVENADVQINITNSIGQLVISKELTNVQSEKVELNTSTLASGVYMVQFTIGKELVTRKLIVSKQ